jgi:pimeloyl-ACP methyl ester carboxylesterase
VSHQERRPNKAPAAEAAMISSLAEQECGHTPHLEKPEEMLQVLLAFLEEQRVE